MSWVDTAYKVALKNPDVEVQIRGEPVEPPFLPALPRNEHDHFALKFESTWRGLGGPDLVKEYQFHQTRKWKADYAHLTSKVLIELEGGVWNGGRHTRGPGFINDIEKYNAATMLGWRVLRIPTGGLQPATLEEMIEFIRLASIA